MKVNDFLIKRISLLEDLLDEAYDIINGQNNPGWQEWCDKVVDVENSRFNPVQAEMHDKKCIWHEDQLACNCGAYQSK